MSIIYSPWLWAFCAATPLLWKLSGAVIYRLAIHYTTVLGDLEQLGRPRADGKFPGNAVVAGARCDGVASINPNLGIDLQALVSPGCSLLES
jgi:hypothetical protein